MPFGVSTGTSGCAPLIGLFVVAGVGMTIGNWGDAHPVAFCLIAGGLIGLYVLFKVANRPPPPIDFSGAPESDEPESPMKYSDRS